MTETRTTNRQSVEQHCIRRLSSQYVTLDYITRHHSTRLSLTNRRRLFLRLLALHPGVVRLFFFSTIPKQKPGFPSITKACRLAIQHHTSRRGGFVFFSEYKKPSMHARASDIKSHMTGGNSLHLVFPLSPFLPRSCLVGSKSSKREQAPTDCCCCC